MSAVGLDDPLQKRRCCKRSHGNEEDVSTKKADAIPLQNRRSLERYTFPVQVARLDDLSPDAVLDLLMPAESG